MLGRGHGDGVVWGVYIGPPQTTCGFGRKLGTGVTARDSERPNRRSDKLTCVDRRSPGGYGLADQLREKA
jgi:hypothetical protein